MVKSTVRYRHVRRLIGTAAGVAVERLHRLRPLQDARRGRRSCRRSTTRRPSPDTSRCRCRCRHPQPASYNPNSLWRNGSRAFFNDQRAHQVGDILTVKVNINDTAQFQDQTQLSRSTTEDSGITNFIGANTITNPAKAVLPGRILTANGNSQSNGNGTINRQDQLLTNVAAVVTQVLPNGNMVIEGKQEIRLNTEIRELIVAGVVRPEDIESDNTIDLPKSRRGARRLWRPRRHHQHPTGALRPAGGGHDLAVLARKQEAEIGKREPTMVAELSETPVS